ncbi:MAG TPA: hypothetical protein VF987_06170, partial [Rhodospirillales bacterium]
MNDPADRFLIAREWSAGIIHQFTDLRGKVHIRRAAGLEAVDAERPEVDVGRPPGDQVGDDLAGFRAGSQADVLVAEGEDHVRKIRR